MIFADIYLSDREKMDLLSRWIIINSIIYYELDSSVVSDDRFNSNSIQLMDMIKTDKAIFCATRWHYIMKDFDGCTGFDLYNRLNKTDKSNMLREAKWVDNSIKKGWWT